MKIIDLSHIISPDMPVYPGTHSPVFSASFTIEKNGYAEKMISMESHTGTHVDAPAHMIKGSGTLDKYAIDQFIGMAYVADVSGLKKKTIGVEDLEIELEIIGRKDFVLFYTGWSKYWGNEKYFGDFPVLSNELVRKLTGFRLKGIGLDTISLDPVESINYPNHLTVFKKNMIIIENLTNLDKLIGKEFLFICNPLKIAGGDGSPVRACAIIN
jgi:kynurenine formamidase